MPVLRAIVTDTVVTVLQAVALAGSIPREILREDQAVFQNSALLTPCANPRASFLGHSPRLALRPAPPRTRCAMDAA